MALSDESGKDDSTERDDRSEEGLLADDDDGGGFPPPFSGLPQGNLLGFLDDPPYDDEPTQLMLSLVETAEQAADRATVAAKKIMAREDRRASWLLTIESVARRLSRASRHTATLVVWVGLAVLVGRFVLDPTLVSWLKGVLARVLGSALGSGFGFTVPLIVAASLFRREIARLLRRRKDPGDE